jgi:hypothetical protein
MWKSIKGIAAWTVVLLMAIPVATAAKKGNKDQRHKKEITGHIPCLLWRDPVDIRTRNLFYGPGGKEDEPHSRFTFLKEDRSGTNPKFDIQDQDGVKWKVKLGPESRPETVASRLVWAVGYFADEDYFVPVLHVEDMVPLRRGQNLVAPDGSIPNVRLKRSVSGEKAIGEWRWRRNPFVGTREFNGLRVLMALINNWDLKDDNNAIYEEKHGSNSQSPELHYLVKDLGASFGTTGPSWTRPGSRGDLNSYRHSKFITKVTPEYVDFSTPTRPAILYIFNPKQLIIHLLLHWIGKHIPRSDVHWIGQRLAQLSPDQIREAFRAADYPPDQVEAFAQIVQRRIAELSEL